MNVLVTGSCGQLGRTLMDMSEGMPHTFVFTSRTPSPEGGIMCLDITDAVAVEGIMKEKEIDVIINCAGYTDVERAEKENVEAFKVNSEAVGILADAAMRRGAVLIHVSTDYIFDGRSSEPYGEDAEPAPLSAYGRSKLAGELAVLASGCRHIIIRTSWLYSRYGRNFVKTIMHKTEEQSMVRVVSDQVGTPTFAGDLAEFILGIIEKDQLSYVGIYNYTDEGICSWYDFAWEVCDICGNLSEVLPCRTGDYPACAARPRYSVLDKTKVKETFGVDIPYWKDSLRYFMSQI